jgi:hypothetical protein
LERAFTGDVSRAQISVNVGKQGYQASRGRRRMKKTTRGDKEEEEALTHPHAILRPLQGKLDRKSSVTGGKERTVQVVVQKKAVQGEISLIMNCLEGSVIK